MIETLGHGKDIRRNKKRERINVVKERRSSSISADNVNQAAEVGASNTPLIQEDMNESGSSANEKRTN